MGNTSAFFSGATPPAGLVSDNTKLAKTITAGFGTDAATFRDVRALQPEDCDDTVVMALEENADQCKVFRSLKKKRIGSTVHQWNSLDSEGSYKHLSVTEAGTSRSTQPAFTRHTMEAKYMQSICTISAQALKVRSFIDVYSAAKVAGIHSMIKGIEYTCFQGDSNVVPTEFDGFPAAIRAARNEGGIIKSLRGRTIGDVGSNIFEEASQSVYQKGGNIDRAYFPPAIAPDIKALFKDKLVLLTKDANAGPEGIQAWPSAYGNTIRFFGDDYGMDRYYDVKGVVLPDGDELERPLAPTSVTASAAASDGSLFEAVDAGKYMYSVHAVNNRGTSPACKLASEVDVSTGDGVVLTITANSEGPRPTGYIICRSEKGGSETRELCRIKCVGDVTTYKDTNEDLPGTASMILLSPPNLGEYQIAQLEGISTMPLFPTNSAVSIFLLKFYGMLEVRIPRRAYLIKDIAYTGGFTRVTSSTSGVTLTSGT